MRNLKTKVWNIFFLSILLMVTPPAVAQEDLAKQSQNPLGTIISLPFENTFLFGIGPSDSTAYVLNWEPVYPVDLGDWNLINRFIVPAIYSEGQDEDLLLGSSIDIANSSITGLPRAVFSAWQISPILPI